MVESGLFLVLHGLEIHLESVFVLLSLLTCIYDPLCAIVSLDRNTLCLCCEGLCDTDVKPSSKHIKDSTHIHTF